MITIRSGSLRRTSTTSARSQEDQMIARIAGIGKAVAVAKSHAHVRRAPVELFGEKVGELVARRVACIPRMAECDRQ